MLEKNNILFFKKTLRKRRASEREIFRDCCNLQGSVNFALSMRGSSLNLFLFFFVFWTALMGDQTKKKLSKRHGGILNSEFQMIFPRSLF